MRKVGKYVTTLKHRNTIKQITKPKPGSDSIVGKHYNLKTESVYTNHVTVVSQSK